MDEIENGEYEGGFMAPDIQSQAVAPPAAPKYHTTNQLQALVAAKTGEPCKSRNRPALLKKLGMAAEKPTGVTPHQSCGPLCQMDGKTPRHHATCPGVRDKAARKATPRQQAKAAAKAGVAASRAKRASAGPDLRAIALKAVTAAMARKSPPSLRALCEELKERKIQRPRGGLAWLPSSVQSLMRQAAKAAGGKAK